MNLIKPFLLINLFLISFSNIAESITIDSLFNFTSTSDNFELQELVLEYSPFNSDPTWPYKNEPEKADGPVSKARFYSLKQVDLNSKILTLDLGWKKKITQFHVAKASLGISNWSSEKAASSSSSSRLTGSLESKVKISDTVFGDFSLIRSFLYKKVLNRTTNSDLLLANSLSPNILWLLNDKSRIKFRGYYSDLNSNFRYESDISASFAISNSTPWFWVGVGASYLSFEKTTQDYFSPPWFLAYGFRVEYSAPINNNWLFSTGGSLNLFNNSARSGNFGYYSLSSVQYGNRNSFNLKFEFEFILSQQESGKWSSQRIGIVGIIPI